MTPAWVHLPAVERDDYCPRCFSAAVDVVGKHGPFVGCSAFPRCKWGTSPTRPNHRPLTSDELELEPDVFDYDYPVPFDSDDM